MTKQKIIFKKLAEKLIGKNGNERNLLFVKMSKSEKDGMTPDHDFYDLEKKYIGMVNIEGIYSWVSFSNDTDWHVRGHTENIFEQYTEKQAQYFLKFGKIKYGAGEI